MDVGLHPLSRDYAHLLAGLSSFTELERRISTLPTTVERGNAFEVFASAYLALFHADEPSAIHHMPYSPAVAQKLGVLQSQDTGIDAVLESTNGLTAVQVKFRSGRGSLSLRDLATFFAVSERAERRLIVSNCESLSEKLGDRVHTSAILANRFDALTPMDFADIAGYLQQAAALPRVGQAPMIPHEYQDDAAQCTVNALAAHSRATVVMACGTGKTLVQTEIARIEAPPRVAVFVPSLSLIRQQLQAWRRAGLLRDRRSLVVCSDEDAGQPGDGDDDSVRLSKEEVGCPVTTEPGEIETHLLDVSTPIVVFCTYHSSRVLSDGCPSDFVFDLALLDEAHRTTGPAGRAYSAALIDANIRILKRAFFTATPRYVTEVLEDCDDGKQGVYSMEDERIYGPVAYELSFREAIEKGYICDYRVLVVVITNEAITEARLRYSQLADGVKTLRAREAAVHIAIDKAMQEHGLKKGIAFFGRASDAERFAEVSNRTFYKTQGPNLLWIKGALPGSVRETRLTQYRTTPSAIISQVRCLTEGVDVPATDFVAFMSPKRSVVDIAQAVGRCLRKDPDNPNKNLGYILVPLFVETAAGESVEDAVERANFREIWEVLSSLREQDRTLAELAYSLKDSRHLPSHQAWVDFNRRVSISCDAPFVDLGSLHRSIATRALSNIDNGWDVQFAKLSALAETNGSCEVPESPAMTKLMAWTHKQRSLFRANRLAPERVRALDAIGFDWTMVERTWLNAYERYREFLREHGRSDLVYVRKHKPSLAQWMVTQRSYAASGRLSQEKRALLNEAGFSYSKQSDVLGRMKPADTIAELEEYVRINGHCTIPEDGDSEGLSERVRWLKRHAESAAGATWRAPLLRLGAYLPNGSAEWESSFAAWKKARAAGRPFTPDVAAWAEAQLPRVASRVDRLTLRIPERYADYVTAEPNRFGDLEYVRLMKPNAIRAKMRERSREEGLADRLAAAGIREP